MVSFGIPIPYWAPTEPKNSIYRSLTMYSFKYAYTKVGLDFYKVFLNGELIGEFTYEDCVDDFGMEY